MKRGRFARAAFLFLTALGLLLAPLPGSEPRPAYAHPIGNFSVNRYARIELESGRVAVRYVLDMAEIPAFQERQAIDRDGDGSIAPEESATYLETRLDDIAGKIDLLINGEGVSLTALQSQLSFPEGQGGLTTLRLTADFEGTLPAGWEAGVKASFRDGNYSDRVGWKEIVVRGGYGVSIAETSVPWEDTSFELTSYP